MDPTSLLPPGRRRPARCLPRLLAATLPLVATLALAQPGGDAVAPASEPAETAPRPSRLDAPLLYQMLLGELSLGAGDPSTGYALYLEAAQRDHDPALYRRAIEIALQGRAGESALAAAKGWARDIPESVEAARFVLQIQLLLNRPADTAGVLRTVIDHTPDAERVDMINAIPQAYARVTDKALALREVRKALAPHLGRPDTGPAAWTSIGRLELASEQLDAAFDAATRGVQLDPASPYPALLAVELLERGRQDAEALVRRHLATLGTGDHSPARLAYARLLLDRQRLAEAGEQLERVIAARPELPEPWLLRGSLQVQAQADDQAVLSLERYLQLAERLPSGPHSAGLTQAYLLMAQLAERRQDYEAANAWLDRIENRDEIMAVQMRRASLLARQGRMDEARQLLREFPETRPEIARLKLMAEARLLRDFKAWELAYEVFGQAYARFPEDTDLLYDQAMMAEKAGRFEDMERLLRQLIALDPDHHHAYNALGYALADRNMRLDEARRLIEKAVEMAPHDAYIQDSLAWVEFRQGNVRKALDILQAAYARQPDPEIAAHLGEVLWVAGQREEALRVWREGLTMASDNETLRSTLRRFKVEP
jgi:tetratricopeptide (TPR) repeat protein